MVENKGKDKAFNWVIYIVMGLYALITLLPLLFVVANSISGPQAVANGLVTLLPKVDSGKVGVSFEVFKIVLQNDSILRGFLNTLLYTVLGTVIQLVFQFTAAYPLSRPDLKGKGFVNFYMVITMFISGGIIPTYFVVKDLGMIDTMWANIIPGCVGVYNIIIIRTYIQSSISWEYQEAAMIDGCDPIRSFIFIVLPLCKPIIAVMILYAVVGYWNAYFNSLMYVSKDTLWPLQRVLQRILITSDMANFVGDTGAKDYSAAIKYVVIIVSSLPILLIYPFFQKFFEQGLMVGGLKG